MDNCCRLPDLHTDLAYLRDPACKVLCPEYTKNSGVRRYKFRGVSKSGTSVTALLLDALWRAAHEHAGYSMVSDNSTRKQWGTVQDIDLHALRGFDTTVDHSRKVITSATVFEKHVHFGDSDEEMSLVAFFLVMRSIVTRTLSSYNFNYTFNETMRIPPRGACSTSPPRPDPRFGPWNRKGCISRARVQSSQNDAWVFQRNQLGGLFPITYNEVAVNKTAILRRAAAWVGFSQEDIEKMTPTFEATSQILTPKPKANSESAEPTSEDIKTRAHFRKAVSSDVAALDEWSRDDVTTLTRAACAYSPFMANLFYEPGFSWLQPCNRPTQADRMLRRPKQPKQPKRNN